MSNTYGDTTGANYRMNPARKYTRDEAAQCQRMDECASNGHTWTMIQSTETGPVRIVCHCGWSGEVTMSEMPQYPVGTE